MMESGPAQTGGMGGVARLHVAVVPGTLPGTTGSYFLTAGFAAAPPDTITDSAVFSLPDMV